MTKRFVDHLIQDRRLVILRLIKGAGGAANDSVLTAGVRMSGHETATRDDVRADLDFLKERGCITIDWFEDKVRVAHLTERGQDVVAGRIEVDGVKKPSPGAS
ncbi:VpaChn25_0724 family phage protein [Dongia deserti]|uniref:VpaChn25_0724 family phage protein n=1 Tax=Dongia deserti TaxID=2268030 RepID=UPI000E65900B|nr:hypothetical protein [Dongia deserti]